MYRGADNVYSYYNYRAYYQLAASIVHPKLLEEALDAAARAVAHATCGQRLVRVVRQ